MLRRALTGALAVAAVLTLADGACVAAQEAPKEAGPAGTWEIKGADTGGIKWKGTLVLKKGEDGVLSGHIDWSGSDGASGREHVRATFDPKTRILKLEGTKLERAEGAIDLGRYTAEMSEDGSRLEKGKWSDDGPPGRWTAKRSDVARPPGRSKAVETGFVDKTYTRADGSTADYVVFVPHSYDGTKEYPVVLFLHGSGEKKGGGQPVDNGLGPHIRKHERTFPFIVLFPQAEETGWMPKGPNGELAIGILDKTLVEYRTDRNRVYLTGLSLGGFGTWFFAIAWPERWAAIVPICGGANPEKAERIKDIPCWAFHGAADETIPVERSREMIAAIKEAGGNPRYTEFPKAGHECWDKAYTTPALWKWLGEQKRAD